MCCLSSLDHPETNPQSLQTQSRAQHRVHAAVWDERARHIRAFEESGDPALTRRAEKMGLCCVAPMLRIEQGRVPVVCPGRCKDRLCPICCRVRGRLARERIRGLVLKADSVRMLTLTMPSTEADLGEKIDTLLSAFQRLRRTTTWKNHVRGGLFVVEVTRGQRGDHWHAHLHVLAEGSYFAYKTLTAAWASAIGATGITDIRAVHSRLQAANYVTKYVSKGADTKSWSDETLCDYARGIFRRRLYGTFGTWHRADVTKDNDEPDAKCPAHGVSLQQIVDAVESNTLDREATEPLLHRLGFVASRMLNTPAAPYDENAAPLSAADFAQLTMFGLKLLNVTSTDETPPPPPPPTNRWTSRLFDEHHV